MLGLPRGGVLPRVVPATEGPVRVGFPRRATITGAVGAAGGVEHITECGASWFRRSDVGSLDVVVVNGTSSRSRTTGTRDQLGRDEPGRPTSRTRYFAPTTDRAWRNGPIRLSVRTALPTPGCARIRLGLPPAEQHPLSAAGALVLHPRSQPGGSPRRWRVGAPSGIGRASLPPLRSFLDPRSGALCHWGRGRT